MGNEEDPSSLPVKDEHQYNICIGKNNFAQTPQLALLEYNWHVEKLTLSVENILYII